MVGERVQVLSDSDDEEHGIKKKNFSSDSKGKKSSEDIDYQMVMQREILEKEQRL